MLVSAAAKPSFKFGVPHAASIPGAPVPTATAEPARLTPGWNMQHTEHRGIVPSDTFGQQLSSPQAASATGNLLGQPESSSNGDPAGALSPLFGQPAASQPAILSSSAVQQSGCGPQLGSATQFKFGSQAHQSAAANADSAQLSIQPGSTTPLFGSGQHSNAAPGFGLPAQFTFGSKAHQSAPTDPSHSVAKQSAPASQPGNTQPAFSLAQLQAGAPSQAPAAIFTNGQQQAAPPTHAPAFNSTVSFGQQSGFATGQPGSSAPALSFGQQQGHAFGPTGPATTSVSAFGQTSGSHQAPAAAPVSGQPGSKAFTFLHSADSNPAFGWTGSAAATFGQSSGSPLMPAAAPAFGQAGPSPFASTVFDQAPGSQQVPAAAPSFGQLGPAAFTFGQSAGNAVGPAPPSASGTAEIAQVPSNVQHGPTGLGPSAAFGPGPALGKFCSDCVIQLWLRKG